MVSSYWFRISELNSLIRGKVFRIDVKVMGKLEKDIADEHKVVELVSISHVSCYVVPEVVINYMDVIDPSFI